jgi:hypothetical protein
VLLSHTGNYRSGDQGGSSSGYVGDPLRKHQQISMDLHRFLSKHPVRDTYGDIETPKNSGLIPSADTATVPEPLPMARPLGLGRTEIRKSEIPYGYPINKKHFDITFNES